jgi:ribulose-phosphate 3-epimerase
LSAEAKITFVSLFPRDLTTALLGESRASVILYRLMGKAIVAASLLAADMYDMRSEISRMEAAGADWLHVDVMDGRFVPAVTFGDKIVADLKPHSRLPFDVHLMTVEPERLVPDFVAAGADSITFHLEAAVHAHRIAETIRSAGLRCGISIVPSTPAILLSEMLPIVDIVLVMTVDPGAGGQALIPACLGKCSYLAAERVARGLSFRISVDGGVNAETAGAAGAAGADILVMGTALFSAPDPATFLRGVRASWEAGRRSS